VRFNAVIGEDGRVRNLTLISGQPLLVPAAMQAVEQFMYQPAYLNGQPVEVETEIDVQFHLTS
jgi:protein TonB